MERIAFHQFNEREDRQYLTFYIFVKNFLNPRQMAYSVVAVFCLMLIGVGAHIIPSYGANPGGPLYNARVMVERMPLVVLSDQAKVTKEVELAQKRQDEVEKILASDAQVSDKSNKIKSVVKHLARNVEETKKQMDELGKKNEKQKTRAAASAVKESVALIKKSIEGVKIAVAHGELTESANVEAQKLGLQIADAELSTLGILIDTVEEPQTPNPEVIQGETNLNNEQEGIDVEKEKTDEPTITPDAVGEESKEAIGSEIEIIGEPATESEEAALPASAEEQREDTFKEEVRHDLEESIAELERAIEKIKTEEDETTITETTEAVKEESEEITEEVVLNVSDIIDKEKNARERDKKITDVKNLLAEAKQEALNGAFKTALGFIKDAKKLMESI